MTVSVLLVDDQALVRAGFRMIVGAESDLRVVGEAEDGDEAIHLARSLNPDVVLMDIQMPKTDGIEATRRIVAEPETDARVVILTTFERDDYVFEALRAGASGFLLKNAPPEELLHAVRVVAEGNALLSPSVTRRVIAQYAAAASPSKVVEDGLARLTDREREVLRSLADGKSNAEVADSLFVGEGTVKTHVSHILTKLALRDRMQAVVFAYESGLITPGTTS
jgi:DNA-binding NarL/FixJ family response regulator